MDENEVQDSNAMTLSANEILAWVEQIDSRVFELAVERARNQKLRERISELEG